MASQENFPDLKDVKEFDQIKPSIAYEQATDSPVYRLSELMFGSLLASYVLGFIGFLAAQISTQPSHERWDIFLLAIKYTSVSVAYAYLTASFYLSYHAGILTLHNMPLKRLGFDFILSLAQAVLFGYSMLYPRLFPVHIACLLAAAIVRQGLEYRHHVEGLFGRQIEDTLRTTEARGETKSKRRRVTKRYRLQFAVELNKRSEADPSDWKYPELVVWKPVGRWLQGFTILLLVLGVLIWYLVANQEINPVWPLLGSWRFSDSWHLSEDWVAWESLLVAGAIVFRGHRTIQERATFLYNRRKETTKMDKQFDDLLRTLKVR